MRTLQASGYLKKLEEVAKAGKIVIHFTEQFPGEQRHDYRSSELPWYDGRGNLSFMTNNAKVAEVVKDWSEGEDQFEPPKCTADLCGEELQVLLKRIHEANVLEVALTAFPAEMAQEEAEEGRSETFDCIVDDEDIGDGQN